MGQNILVPTTADGVRATQSMRRVPVNTHDVVKDLLIPGAQVYYGYPYFGQSLTLWVYGPFRRPMTKADILGQMVIRRHRPAGLIETLLWSGGMHLSVPHTPIHVVALAAEIPWSGEYVELFIDRHETRHLRPGSPTENKQTAFDAFACFLAVSL